MIAETTGLRPAVAHRVKQREFLASRICEDAAPDLLGRLLCLTANVFLTDRKDPTGTHQ